MGGGGGGAYDKFVILVDKMVCDWCLRPASRYPTRCDGLVQTGGKAGTLPYLEMFPLMSCINITNFILLIQSAWFLSFYRTKEPVMDTGGVL